MPSTHVGHLLMFLICDIYCFYVALLIVEVCLLTLGWINVFRCTHCMLFPDFVYIHIIHTLPVLAFSYRPRFAFVVYALGPLSILTLTLTFIFSDICCTCSTELYSITL